MLLLSTSETEIIGEFMCMDGSIRDCSAPYALVSDSIQRALIEPSFKKPNISGRYRVDTDGDGWYAGECMSTTFQNEKLLDSSSCIGNEEYVCVCPITETENTDPSLKLRYENVTYTLGHGLGYDNGTFVIYQAGYYTVSSETNRTIQWIGSGESIQASCIESADFSSNYTLIQIVNGTIEHQVGTQFNYSGTEIVIPWRSIWEFVGENLTFVHDDDKACGPTWCAYWFEENQVISVSNSTTFFLRDILPSQG
jgi:hypothetical protein